MFRYIFALFALSFCFKFSWANLCGEEEREVQKVNISKQRDLVACAIPGLEKNKMTLVSVMEFNQGVENLIFEPDHSFKIYQVSKKDKSLLITEGLTTDGQNFLPLFEILVSCDSKQCQSEDKKCVAPKNSPKYDYNILSAKKTEKAVDQLKPLLLAALNGDALALKIFAKSSSVEQHFFNATFSEEYQTYKSDIDRAKKINCIK